MSLIHENCKLRDTVGLKIVNCVVDHAMQLHIINSATCELLCILMHYVICIYASRKKKNTRTTVLYEFHVINFKNFTATYFKHKRNCFSYATPVLQKTVTNYILQLPAQICAKPVSSCVKLLTYSLQFTGSISSSSSSSSSMNLQFSLHAEL